MTKALFVAVVGRKGGTGKTTLALALGAMFSRAGRRALLLDLDPQGSATLAAGAEPSGAKLVAFLTGETQPDPVPIADGLDMLAGGPELETMPRPPMEIREALHAMPADVVLIDCPPGHAELDRLAMRSADVVLACCEPHRMAIAGAARVLDEAKAHRHKPRCAVVLGRMDERRGLDRAAPELLAGAFSLPVFCIRQDATLAAAMNAGELPPAHGRAFEDLEKIARWISK